MEFISYLIDLFLHLDKHLYELITNYGSWTYAILFMVIFCETGLVVTPFLPGDSLLFAAGTFAATGSLDIRWLILLLTAAAVLGDAANYMIGARVGHRILASKHRRFIKQEYIDRTHKFYEKYGGKTIIIARFVPIIRTFAPFLAGLGEMTYIKFATYNVVGAILWVVGFCAAGYWFGNMPMVRRNFTWVIIAIVIISVLPAVIEYLRHRRGAKAAAEADRQKVTPA